MAEKYTYESVKTLVEGKKCKLLESHYENCKTSMTFQCECGKLFATCLDKFINRNKTKCDDCTMSEKHNKLRLSFAYVKEIITHEGCELLSTDYSTVFTPLIIKCPCGSVYSTNFNQFTSKVHPKTRCNKCTKQVIANQQRHSNDYIDDTIKSFGCRWIAGEYKSNESLLVLQCACGNHFKTTFGRFINSKKPKRQCNKCSQKTKHEKLRHSYDYVKQLIESNECQLLSETYVNEDTKLLLKCKCGNEFATTFINFCKKNKTRCDSCVSEKTHGENEIERVLQKLNLDYQYQYSLNDCINKRKLKFDFAVFDSSKMNLLCLVEFDGQQHFYHIPWYGDENAYRQQIKRDQLKNKYCTEKNIKLIRIPYYEFHNIEKIISESI